MAEITIQRNNPFTEDADMLHINWITTPSQIIQQPVPHVLDKTILCKPVPEYSPLSYQSYFLTPNSYFNFSKIRIPQTLLYDFKMVQRAPYGNGFYVFYLPTPRLTKISPLYKFSRERRFLVKYHKLSIPRWRRLKIKKLKKHRKLFRFIKKKHKLNKKTPVSDVYLEVGNIFEDDFDVLFDLTQLDTTQPDTTQPDITQPVVIHRAVDLTQPTTIQFLDALDSPENRFEVLRVDRLNSKKKLSLVPRLTPERRTGGLDGQYGLIRWGTNAYFFKGYTGINRLYKIKLMCRFRTKHTRVFRTMLATAPAASTNISAKYTQMVSSYKKQQRDTVNIKNFPELPRVEDFNYLNKKTLTDNKRDNLYRALLLRVEQVKHYRRLNTTLSPEDNFLYYNDTKKNPGVFARPRVPAHSVSKFLTAKEPGYSFTAQEYTKFVTNYEYRLAQYLKNHITEWQNSKKDYRGYRPRIKHNSYRFTTFIKKNYTYNHKAYFSSEVLEELQFGVLQYKSTFKKIIDECQTKQQQEQNKNLKKKKPLCLRSRLKTQAISAKVHKFTKKRINFFAYKLLPVETKKIINPVLKKNRPVWLKYRKPNIFWFRLNSELKRSKITTALALKRLFKTDTRAKNQIRRSLHKLKLNLSKFLHVFLKSKKKKTTVFLNKKRGFLKRHRSKVKTKANSLNPRTINLHRGTIKIFWKSQRLWRETYFKKQRWTARKLFHKFRRWYKKAPKISNNERNAVHPQLWTLLIRLNVFLSKLDCQVGADAGMIHLNGKKILDTGCVLQVGDIVSLPCNLAELINFVKQQRVLIRKIIKKEQYTYYKNRESRWRDLKKKFNPQIVNILYNSLSVPNWVQYDLAAAYLCIVKLPHKLIKFDRYLCRHDLEKLNTWKLRL